MNFFCLVYLFLYLNICYPKPFNFIKFLSDFTLSKHIIFVSLNKIPKPIKERRDDLPDVPGDQVQRVLGGLPQQKYYLVTVSQRFLGLGR